MENEKTEERSVDMCCGMVAHVHGRMVPNTDRFDVWLPDRLGSQISEHIAVEILGL